MGATVVKPDPRWPSVRLWEPLPHGYLHLAAAVEPPPPLRGGRVARPGRGHLPGRRTPTVDVGRS